MPEWSDEREMEGNDSVDGLALAALGQASKGPPEAIARGWLPGYPAYLPLVFRFPGGP